MKTYADGLSFALKAIESIQFTDGYAITGEVFRDLIANRVSAEKMRAEREEHVPQSGQHTITVEFVMDGHGNIVASGKPPTVSIPQTHSKETADPTPNRPPEPGWMGS